jgi:hypothetical protein
VSVGTPISVSAAAPAVTASSGSATPAATPSATAATGATSGGTGLYSLPITAQVSGTTTQLAAFLTQLQTVQPRAVLITQITQTATVANGSGSSSGASPGSGSATTTLQLTMSAFVAPSSAAEQQALASSASH